MRAIEDIKADIERIENRKTVHEDHRQINLQYYNRELIEAITDGIPLDRLEAICQAERDGRCVVLPVAVGDTVWFLDSKLERNENDLLWKKFVMDGKIKAIKFTATTEKITVEYEDLNDRNGRCKGADYFIRNFGKTVFLTKEEAEQALKEGKV